MIRLLQWLIFGHVHEWEIHETGQVERTYKPTGTRKYVMHILRCKQCGITRRRVLDQ